MELITQDNSDSLIRSSKVRDLVRRGEMRQASTMLGRHYALIGEVVRGEGRGRQIGVPTANLSAWPEQIMPANGVYASWAKLDDEVCLAATHVGRRPTFGGTGISIEPHLLDFDRDIYGGATGIEICAALAEGTQIREYGRFAAANPGRYRRRSELASRMSRAL